MDGKNRRCARLKSMVVITGTTHGIGRITSRERAKADTSG